MVRRHGDDGNREVTFARESWSGAGALGLGQAAGTFTESCCNWLVLARMRSMDPSVRLATLVASITCHWRVQTYVVTSRICSIHASLRCLSHNVWNVYQCQPLCGYLTRSRNESSKLYDPSTSLQSLHPHRPRQCHHLGSPWPTRAPSPAPPGRS